MSDLVENDTSVALLSHHLPEIFHFMFSSDGGGGHSEYRALAELAVNFERYIGAKFSLKMVQVVKSIEKKR